MTDPRLELGPALSIAHIPVHTCAAFILDICRIPKPILGSREHLPLRGCDRMAIPILANISSGFPVMAIDYELRNYPVANNAFSTRLAYKSSAAALKTKQQAHLGYCQRRVSSPSVTF